jgi:hypothetical protein
MTKCKSCLYFIPEHHSRGICVELRRKGMFRADRKACTEWEAFDDRG